MCEREYGKRRDPGNEVEIYLATNSKSSFKRLDISIEHYFLAIFFHILLHFRVSLPLLINFESMWTVSKVIIEIKKLKMAGFAKQIT